jgi:hypothetical protein
VKASNEMWEYYQQENHSKSMGQLTGDLNNEKEVEMLECSLLRNKPKNDEMCMIDEKFIRSDEAGVLMFTKKGILDFINRLDSLKECETLHKSETLNLFCFRNGSELSPNFYLGKCTYTLRKREIYKDYTGNKIITIKNLRDIVKYEHINFNK